MTEEMVVTAGWYPKTAADVMKMPEGGILDYKAVDCPRCHHTINVPFARRVSFQPYKDDMVIFVRDANGDAWAPGYDEDKGWYRRRLPI